MYLGKKNVSDFAKSVRAVPSKSLNVYDFGMAMYTSQPITALLKEKLSFDWMRGVHFHAKKLHVQEL